MPCVCDLASRKGRKPCAHRCKRNWSKSAKAMEADTCVENVKAINESGEGVKVSVIVGDEDSSAIAHVRNEVDSSIRKWSDVNHAKKSLGNKLYELKKTHKELSDTVIKAVQKNFAYALNQKKGNAEELKKALKAIPAHMFGDRCGCGSWCGYHKSPDTYTHKNLPRGKDLTSSELRTDLQSVFDTYGRNSNKLAQHGSSQVNESFNQMVSSKAPKVLHLSSSESLSQRVAAAVCQKNVGASYVPSVCKSADLSPGVHTERHARRVEAQRKKSAARKKTLEFKRRRLDLKDARKARTRSTELREGKCCVYIVLVLPTFC